ncbi:hypothetical protein Pse7367_2912 [Thalassoporum mexicanum PCC 7367]|uniref:hypothetical protein n=1 Tax=Thalassoporum mexicanum TaxID=3457544 RepID=UPI00029FE252|nr:hypothetical protein [Pseudanabaena sp. PCC 7367]AFY71165.1 hypothetical protein Pse7367_2912 [Pseudanabaena sp. PCC 7367]
MFKQLVSNTQQKFRVEYAPKQLPLAVYRELAAHLDQVESIATELIWADRQEFDYADSQIAGIEIKFMQVGSDRQYALVESILNYYGSWHLVNANVSLEQAEAHAASRVGTINP